MVNLKFCDHRCVVSVFMSVSLLHSYIWVMGDFTCVINSDALDHSMCELNADNTIFVSGDC